MSEDQKFELGEVYLSRGVADWVGDEQSPIMDLLGRHAQGDWGDLAAEDAASNDQALLNGFQVLSAYECTAPGGEPVRVYVITEADRSSTTVLFPSEY